MRNWVATKGPAAANRDTVLSVHGERCLDADAKARELLGAGMLRLAMRILPLVCFVACCAAFGALCTAQEKRPLQAEHYGQWESLRGSGTLSPDGQWLAYSVSRSNGKNELRLKGIAKDAPEVFAMGTAARFTDDSRFLGYMIGVSEDEREKLTKAKKPVHNTFALRELATDKTVEIAGVSSFRFSENGEYVALHRYKKTGQKKGGSDLIVRDLSNGSEMCFGNVDSFQWSEAANLLAMVIDTEDMVGGSVTLLHADTGKLRVLDSHKARYTSLAWREDANDLAFWRITDHKPEDDEQPSHVLIACRGLTNDMSLPVEYDHVGRAEFPEGMRIVSRAPQWHDDGKAVFFGIRPWDLPPGSEPSAESESEPASSKPANGAKSLRDSLKDPAGVDVWHAKDARIIPQQKKQAGRDRQKSHLCALWLDQRKFVRLGDDIVDSIAVLEGGNHAIGRDTDRHEREAMFGPELSDVYVINTRTGERTRILERHKFVFGGSPDGKKVLFVREDTWHAYDVASGKTRALTAGLTGNFIDNQRGVLTDENRPYGIAGWNKDASSVFLHSRFDLWEITLRNGNVQRHTNGLSLIHI